MRSAANCSWIIVGLLVVALTRVVAADEPADVDPIKIHQAVARAAERPPDPQVAIATARRQLTKSIEELGQLIASGGDLNERRWRQWLDVPALQAQLDSPAPDLSELQSIVKRYYQNQAGLEMSAFVAVRRDLRGYLAARQYADAQSAHDLFRQRLWELERLLARLEADLNQDDAHRVGSIVAWLEALGDEGAAVASAVRQRHCRRNGSLQISGRFINRLLQQDVQQQQFLTDVVLGSFTQGMAFTQGRVSFSVVPSQPHGTLKIRLLGQTSCPANMAERGRVVVHTSARTSIHADKHVFVDSEGLRLAPAAALSASSVQIQDIEARSRLIERVAWRRASRMLPQAEDFASRKAESQASSHLDQQADAALGGVNDVFRREVRAPLIRLGALPARLQFWTDDSHLRLAVAQRNEAQLSAASPPPEVPSGYDLAIYFHESMINNLCEALLGGRTAQDRGWLELMNLLTGTSPRPLWVHDRAERWSVTFAAERPLVVQLDGERVLFTLRFDRLTRGSHQLQYPIEVEARFILTTSHDGPALAREGDLAIRFASGTEQDEEPSARAFLAKKFAAVLPPRLGFEGLVPPAGGTIGKLRQLDLAEFQSHDGWLTLGYQLAQP
jgi:hypothetical protein